MKRLAIPLLSLLSMPVFASDQEAMKLYNTGWNQIYAKQYMKARDSFNKSLQQMPEDKKWLAVDGQGWSAYYLGKYSKAKRIFINNIESKPTASYSYKGLAFVSLQLKEWSQAHTAFIKAVSIDPKQPLTDYFFMYNALMAAKEYSFASDVLSKALPVYPKSADVNFYLAKSLLLSGNESKAYLLLSTATYYDPVKISPLFSKLKNVDLEMAQDSLLNMGWGLYVANYFKASLYRFNQCLEQDKNNVNALRGKGFSLLRLKEYQKANDILEYALQSTGHDKLKPVTTYFTDKNKKSIPVIIDTETMLGWAKYYLGDYLTAKDIFSQVVENNPSWINARLGLAYTQKALGENYKDTVNGINEEAPGYTSYIPEYSSHVLTRAYQKYNTGWNDIFAKKYESALQNIAAAEKDFPKNLKWLADDARAWIEYYKGNYTKAKSDFQKIINSNSYATLSYKGLSYCLLKEKDYKSAYDKAIALLRINPIQKLDSFIFLVNSFISAKQYQYASDILATGLYYYPSSGDMLLAKAMILWEKGDKKNSYKALEAASFYAPVQTKNSLSKFKGLDQSKLGYSILNVAWGLYANREFDKALEVFEKYYNNNKDIDSIATLNSLRGQAFCLVNLGKFEQAAKQLEEVLHNKNSASLKPVSSTFYSIYGTAIPVYVDAQTTLAWAYYSLGEYDKSEDNFRQVLKKHPTWVNARLGLAHVMKASGNDKYKEEVDLVNKYAPGYGAFIPELPANISAQAYEKYNEAWKDVFAKKYDSAIKNFKAAKSKLSSKDKWIADDGIAWVSYNKKDYKAALSQFEKIVSKYPHASLSYKGMAYCYIQMKNYGKAFDSSQRLLKVAPKQGLDVFSFLGYSFLDANQLHFAKDIIIKGLNIYPKSGDLKLYRAQLLWGANKKEEAYKLINEASKVSPLSVEHGMKSMKGIDYKKIKPALLNMGWALYQVFKTDDALKMFNSYLKYSSGDELQSLDYIDAQRGQGFCYTRLQKNDRAKQVLTKVLSNPRSVQLKPIVTYYYPKDSAPVKVYADSRTNLAWVQLSLGEFHQAEINFNQVLDDHPNWINARLGLAYVLKLTDRKDMSEVHLERINKIAPGYGVITLTPTNKNWTFIYKATAAWYKPDSVKNNSQTYQVDALYTPSPGINLGAFYSYQHINFRPPSSFSSRSRQDRAGYSFSLLNEIDNVGWIGPSGKGNYIFFSAYDDDGANNTYFPYWGLTYKTPDLLTTIELGYAKLKFKDNIYSTSEQKTLSVSSTAIENWLLGATLYRSTVKYLGDPSEKLTALNLNATYYFNSKHNLGGFVLLGRRKHAYGLDINKAYDIRDKQNGSFGITYSYNFDNNMGMFTDFSYDKFILDTDTTRKYRVYYFTVGLVM